MTDPHRHEPLDLDAGLPVTAEDVEALHRVRSLGVLDFEAWLDFLSRLPPIPHDQLRSRPGPRGEPFTLP